MLNLNAQHCLACEDFIGSPGVVLKEDKPDNNLYRHHLLPLEDFWFHALFQITLHILHRTEYSSV